MNKRFSAYVMAASAAILLCLSVAMVHGQEGGGESRWKHQHRKSDHVGNILTDMNLVVTTATNTATASIVLQTNGDIYASGSLHMTGATSATYISNVYATDVYVARSVWASGTFYASGGLNVAGNATAAYFYGNGSYLTGLNTATPTLQAVTTTGATTTTYIQATGFKGDGSQITGVLSAGTNVNNTNSVITIGGVMSVRSADSSVGATGTKTTTGANLFTLSTDVTQPGVMGYSIWSKGLNSASNPGLTASQTFTISMWNKNNSTNEGHFPTIGWRSQGSPCAVTLRWGSPTQLHFFYCGGAGGVEQEYRTITIFGAPQNDWTHFIVTHTNGTGIVTAFVNNATQTVSTEDTSAVTVADNSIYIGGNIAGFQDIYDDTRIYSDLLTETERGVLFGSGVGTEEVQSFDDTLVYEWKMNDLTGSTTMTDSVSGKNLTEAVPNGYQMDLWGITPVSSTIISVVNGSTDGEKGKVSLCSQYGSCKVQGQTLEFDTAATSRMTISNAGIVAIPNSLNVGNLGIYTANQTAGYASMSLLTGGRTFATTTAVTSVSMIFLTVQDNDDGLNTGVVSICGRTAGVGFTMCSLDALDTRRVAWFIIEPK